MYRLSFVALAIAIASPAVAQSPAPRITTEAFAQPPFLSAPSLSPDGKSLMARMSIDGATVLGVVELDGKGLEVIPVPDENDLRSYSWAGNRRIVMAMGARMDWFGEGETYVTRAFVYDLDTQKARSIGPKVQGRRGDDILWIDPAGGSLLMATQADRHSYPSIFRVDLSSGAAKLEQGPRDNVWDWYADSTGTVRYGIGSRAKTWFSFYRKAGGGGFDASPPADYDAARTVEQLKLLPGSDQGYALSPRDGGRYALYRYDFVTRTLGEKLFDSATNDLSGTVSDRRTSNLIGVHYTTDRDRIEWIDPAMKALQARLDTTFRGKVVTIGSMSSDRARMVIHVGSATDPGAFYLFQPATGAVARLGKVADKVDPAGLSETRYVSYKARDGLDIPAYLTLPIGREAKGLPLIIMPHGGPYGVRDKLGYDSEVQFLANRGYAVLQPNYRGSEGYGEAFFKKGEGQWGRAMQDDLDDGMDWLVKSGTVDAKRVCLVGGSYGGYAALWGATRNPERYRCAVSFAGVSDLKQQLDYQADFLTGTRWRKDWQNRVRGEKDFDLAQVSPISSATSLKVPVMLAHGDADAIVPVKQTTLYARALAAAGKPHETYIYPGEGHGFEKAANEKDYLDKLEAFLAKHNPS